VDFTYCTVKCHVGMLLVKAFKVKGQIYSTLMKEHLNCINLSLFNCTEPCLLYTAWSVVYVMFFEEGEGGIFTIIIWGVGIEVAYISFHLVCSLFYNYYTKYKFRHNYLNNDWCFPIWNPILTCMSAYVQGGYYFDWSFWGLIISCYQLLFVCLFYSSKVRGSSSCFSQEAFNTRPWYASSVQETVPYEA